MTATNDSRTSRKRVARYGERSAPAVKGARRTALYSLSRNQALRLLALAVVGLAMFLMVRDVLAAETITLDATSSGSATAGAGGSLSSVTYSHTIGSQVNRLLVVGVSVEDSDGACDVSGVTYNGVAMTLIDEADTGSSGFVACSSLWYMLDSSLPAAGAYNVVVSTSGNVDDIHSTAVSVYNARQQSPDDSASSFDAASPTSVSNSVTTVVGGSWVFDSVASGGSSALDSTTNGSQTIRGNLHHTESAVVYDTQSSANTIDATSLTFSHTIGSGDNRVLIVGTGIEDPSDTDCAVTGVTYNSVALTSIDSVLSGTGLVQCVSLWYLDEQDLPTGGTYDVVVSTAGTVNALKGIAMSASDASQSGPDSSNTNFDDANPSSITTSVTTVVDGSMVFDAVGSGNVGDFATTETGQTERAEQSNNSAALAGSTLLDTTAGSVSMGWTQSANRLSHVVAAFAPYESSSGGAVSTLLDSDAGSVSVGWNESNTPRMAHVVAAFAPEPSAFTEATSSIASITETVGFAIGAGATDTAAIAESVQVGLFADDAATISEIYATSITASAEDAAAILDSLAQALAGGATDNLAVSDSALSRIASSGAVGIVDIINLVSTLSAEHAATLLESTLMAIGSSTADTAVIQDFATAGLSFESSSGLLESSIAAISMSRSDFAALSESATQAVVSRPNEPVTLSDNAATALSFLDSASLNQSISMALGYLRSDGVPVAELTVAQLAQSPETMTAALFESVEETIGFSRSDTVTLTTLFTVALAANAADNPQLVESSVASINISFFESATLGESALGLIGKGTFDAETLSEAIAAAVTAQQSTGVPVLDDPVASIVFGRSDAATLSDAFSALLGKTVTDGHSISESATAAIAALTGSIAPVTDSSLAAILSDTGDGSSLAESLAILLGKLATDEVTTSESSTAIVAASAQDVASILSPAVASSGFSRPDITTLAEAMAYVVGKSVTDSVPVTATLLATLGLAEGDALSVDAQSIASLTFGRPDGASLSELMEYIIGKSIVDGLPVGESLLASIGASTLDSAALGASSQADSSFDRGDGASLVEAVERLIGFNGLAELNLGENVLLTIGTNSSDSLSISDLSIAALLFDRSESIAVSEFADSALGLTTRDPVTFSESLLAALTGARSDNTTVVEQITAVTGFSMTDVTPVADDLAYVLGLSATEGIPVFEQLAAMITSATADQSALGENALTDSSFTRSDTNILTELASYVLGVAVSDNPVLGESFAVALTSTLDEAATVEASTVSSAQFGRIDGVSLSELLSHLLGASQDDQVSITDSPGASVVSSTDDSLFLDVLQSATSGFGRTETVALSEFMIYVVGSSTYEDLPVSDRAIAAIQAWITDNAGIGDQALASVAFGRSDLAGVTDLVDYLLGIRATESSPIAESLLASIASRREDSSTVDDNARSHSGLNEAESIAIFDVLTGVLGFSAPDNAIITGSLRTAFGYGLSDTSTLNSSTSASARFVRVELLQLSDFVSHLLGISAPVTTSISDSLLTNLQSRSSVVVQLSDLTHAASMLTSSDLLALNDSAMHTLGLSHLDASSISDSSIANINAYISDGHSVSALVSHAMSNEQVSVLSIGELTGMTAAFGQSENSLIGDFAEYVLGFNLEDGVTIFDAHLASIIVWSDDAAALEEELLTTLQSRSSVIVQLSDLTHAASMLTSSDLLALNDSAMHTLGLSHLDAASISDSSIANISAYVSGGHSMSALVSHAISNEQVSVLNIGELTGMAAAFGQTENSLVSDFAEYVIGFNLDDSPTIFDAHMASINIWPDNAATLRENQQISVGGSASDEAPINSAVDNVVGKSVFETEAIDDDVELGSGFVRSSETGLDAQQTDLDIWKEDALLRIRSTGDTPLSIGFEALSGPSPALLTAMLDVSKDLGDAYLKVRRPITGSSLQYSGNRQLLGEVHLSLTPRNQPQGVVYSGAKVLFIDNVGRSVFLEPEITKISGLDTYTVEPTQGAGTYFLVETVLATKPKVYENPAGPIPPFSPDRQPICSFLVTPAAGGSATAEECGVDIRVAAGIAGPVYSYAALYEPQAQMVSGANGYNPVDGAQFELRITQATEPPVELDSLTRLVQLCVPMSGIPVGFAEKGAFGLQIADWNDTTRAWTPLPTNIDRVSGLLCANVASTGVFGVVTPSASVDPSDPPKPWPVPTATAVPTEPATTPTDPSAIPEPVSPTVPSASPTSVVPGHGTATAVAPSPTPEDGSTPAPPGSGISDTPAATPNPGPVDGIGDSSESADDDDLNRAAAFDSLLAYHGASSIETLVSESSNLRNWGAVAILAMLTVGPLALARRRLGPIAIKHISDETIRSESHPDNDTDVAA